MAQTDGGWCTVSVHDVGADMLGRVLSAHDGGADGWASGVCARRRCRQWLGERCLRKMAAQTRDSADWLPHIYPPCLAGHLSRPFVAGAVDRGICVKKLNFYSASSSECDFVLTNLISSQMCSSQYRASPPYTAVSPSRAFVFMISTADSRMTMDLPSMRSSGSHTYPPYTAVSPSRAFVFGAADRRMTLGGDRLRETMAQTVGAQYLRWGGERCLRKMAAQAHMVGRTVPAQDGGAGTRFSGLVLAREAAQTFKSMCSSRSRAYPPCTSGSSSPAFLSGTDRGTYAKKLNSCDSPDPKRPPPRQTRSGAKFSPFMFEDASPYRTDRASLRELLVRRAAYPDSDTESLRGSDSDSDDEDDDLSGSDRAAPSFTRALPKAAQHRHSAAPATFTRWVTPPAPPAPKPFLATGIRVRRPDAPPDPRGATFTHWVTPHPPPPRPSFLSE
ncbi:hypothetical protein C8F04DRAFT_1280276 [Mycena alexandri]|uniref:Uncharacterized protein n=1 Tax=Mycena alexandri TaxID=1745969 RepID=A0AAD6WLK3_9AGAR|nr:hypothetical protein C8F04DRAFT_1280276 [Mycena alexandri]